MIERVKSLLLNILFPKKCLGCGRSGISVCKKCLGSLKFLESQECPVCRRQSDLGQKCQEKCKETFYFDALIVSMEYQKNPLLKNLIKALKYNFNRELIPVLGEILKTQYVAWAQYFFELRESTIVAVPINSKRWKERGFNQAEELAKYLYISLKNHFGGLDYSDCLIRTDSHKKQSLLNRKERLANLKGCISFKGKSLCGRNVVIVDDVATTGSTLNECARILKENGAGKLTGLVLARGR